MATGYAGDVWNVQPAPKDHVLRTAKNTLGGGNGMVPHYSGTTLDAQARYASGTKSIIENYLTNKPQEAQNIIVGLGKFETKACECPFRPFARRPCLMCSCRRPALKHRGCGCILANGLTYKKHLCICMAIKGQGCKILTVGTTIHVFLYSLNSKRRRVFMYV
jgi:hypothetical protein